MSGEVHREEGVVHSASQGVRGAIGALYKCCWGLVAGGITTYTGDSPPTCLLQKTENPEGKDTKPKQVGGPQNSQA